jgi:TRAP-type C4-dicarboxylate transport system permease small subunit
MLPSRDLRGLMKAFAKIEKIFDIFEKGVTFILQVLLTVIISIVFYSIVMRYVFSYPPAWAEELSRFIFIWMLMLGAFVVTRDQSHIEFTIVVERLPKKVKTVLWHFTRLCMLAFCWVLFQQGIRIYPIVAEAASPTFAISMGWIYVAIPVSGFLMMVVIVEKMIRSVLVGDIEPFKTSLSE